MSYTTPISRRNFLKRTGAMALGAAALSAASYRRVLGANDRITLGIIGCGGIAGHHLDNLLPIRDAQNIALGGVCDVYRCRAEAFEGKIAEAGGKAVVYPHHAGVLEDPGIDSVLIATPEHSHARLALDALDAGKHVYVEKPMTHSIPEAQRVLRRAETSGLKVQTGVQGMADDSYASAHEVVRSGLLGTLVHAQIDYVRSYGAAGPWRRGTDPDMPKPEDLDWKEWLKPARQRPWDPLRYFEWRNYRDYSGGVATDLFVHRITRLIRACGLGLPSRVSGMGGIYIWPDGRELPDNFEMMCEYPAIPGISNGMTVHVLGTMANDHGNPHCIRGTEATLTFTSSGWEVKALGSGDVLATHQKTGAEDVALHHANHFDAIRTGAQLFCPPDLGYYAVAAVCMGNLSWFKRRMMKWDDRRNRPVPA